MRLGQIRWNNDVTAAIFEGNLARPVPDHTLYDLVRRSEIDHVPLRELARQQASSHREEIQPVIPIHPRELWACGGTYDLVERRRPEISFKGTARVCVGPNKPIGIRSDSTSTVPEPELAVLLGSRGAILGYTLANDVTAWDLLRDEPLHLSEAKIFNGCCALGPFFITPDELADPRGIEIAFSIRRGEETIFSAAGSIARLNREIGTLVETLLRGNTVPSGSVLLTGSCIAVPRDAALAPGDVVTLDGGSLGVLSNPAALV
ncbi:MAG: fumarylacetoacetate hydrolase family protein [Acidobacteria bacterium]|nr:fumarylacetoacetate hydrolase family protein [Acidobacteriota bacterium]